MVRSLFSILGCSIVLATTACGAQHRDTSAENRTVLERAASRSYSNSDRRLIAAAVKRSDTEGVSLTGKPLEAIIAEERQIEIIRANERLIAENARYNKFHQAVGVVPKSEQSLDGPGVRQPLISGSLDRAASSL